MAKKLKKQSEYNKVVSSAPIKGLFSMPSKKDKAMKKKKSIFEKTNA
jgi:hypothetical protein